MGDKQAGGGGGGEKLSVGVNVMWTEGGKAGVRRFSLTVVSFD